LIDISKGLAVNNWELTELRHQSHIIIPPGNSPKPISIAHASIPSHQRKLRESPFMFAPPVNAEREEEVKAARVEPVLELVPNKSKLVVLESVVVVALVLVGVSSDGNDVAAAGVGKLVGLLELNHAVAAAASDVEMDTTVVVVYSVLKTLVASMMMSYE